MNKELRILYIEDNADEREGLKEVLSDQKVNGHTMIIDCEPSFDKAIEKSQNYHIVILDLYKGDATNGGEELGSEIFKKVRGAFFVPIVFYSGNIASIKDLKSQVVGVASKGGEIDDLISEIERLSKHNLPFLKESVHKYVEEEFKKYFWDVVQKENDRFVPNADDYSLGYMLLRNFADSLSKENIKKIIGDDTINHEKVHPMEFYIYPIEKTKEFENGEIIRRKNSNDIFVILTPSCDFVSGEGRKRKVEHVLLVKSVSLEQTDEYKKFSSIKKKRQELTDYATQIDKLEQKGGDDVAIEKLKKQREKLELNITNMKASFSQFLNSGKSDRFFFLPGTPFMSNRVIDFQDKTTADYSSLKTDFERIAKLDSPFAQSMTSSFIRYYNRIGFPDIDTDYVINHLEL